MSESQVTEEFKPIPIRRDSGPLDRAAFAARMALDLQLLTCTRFLASHLARMQGDVLDVGCGEMPFRAMLGEGARYTCLDVPAADDFGMRRHPEIVDFDGLAIPFADASFDDVCAPRCLSMRTTPWP